MTAEFDERGAYDPAMGWDIFPPEGRIPAHLVCRECRGDGVVYTEGYYVPGEQFVEPPTGPDMCGPCLGTGRTRLPTDPPINPREGN